MPLVSCGESSAAHYRISIAIPPLHSITSAPWLAVPTFSHLALHEEARPRPDDSF